MTRKTTGRQKTTAVKNLASTYNPRSRGQCLAVAWFNWRWSINVADYKRAEAWIGSDQFKRPWTKT